MQKKKEIWFYAGLLALSLGLAFFVSRQKPSGEDERYELASFDEGNILLISLNSEGSDVKVTKENNRVWLEVKEKEGTQEVHEKFLASADIKNLWSAMKPVYAQKRLGEFPKDQLANFGLDEKAETFVVKAEGGKELTLKLGKKSYGSRNIYATKDNSQSKAEVILVDGTAFENLKRARNRLYERRIVFSSPEDGDKMIINLGKKSKTLVRKNKDEQGLLGWSGEEDKTVNVSDNTLVDKLLKLRVQRYAVPEEIEFIQKNPPQFSVKIFKGDKVIENLQFFSSQPSDIQGLDDVNRTEFKNDYWVFSSSLETVGKLTPARAETVFKDFKSL